MELRTIWGNSRLNIFVYCWQCKKKFSWLKAKQSTKGVYYAECYKCRHKDDNKPILILSHNINFDNRQRIQ